MLLSILLSLFLGVSALSLDIGRCCIKISFACKSEGENLKSKEIKWERAEIQQRSRWTKGTKGKCPEKVHPPAGKGCDKGPGRKCKRRSGGKEVKGASTT